MEIDVSVAFENNTGNDTWTLVGIHFIEED